jgi:hypothetical protein
MGKLLIKKKIKKKIGGVTMEKLLQGLVFSFHVLLVFMLQLVVFFLVDMIQTLTLFDVPLYIPLLLTTSVAIMHIRYLVVFKESEDPS